VLTMCVVLILALSVVLSSEVLTITFALLKGQAPIWTTLVNFVKVQRLLQTFYENSLEVLGSWRKKIVLFFKVNDF